MNNDYIGERIKTIRTELLSESQKEFCNNINRYIKIYYPESFDKLKFRQDALSLFENSGNNISLNKFNILINYLYTKKINPNWILLKNNNTQPQYVTTLEIDKNLVDITKDIKQKFSEINKDLNDIQIIVENTTYKRDLG